LKRREGDQVAVAHAHKNMAWTRSAPRSYRVTSSDRVDPGARISGPV